MLDHFVQSVVEKCEAYWFMGYECDDTVAV
jgi:hypothetical protein